MSQPNILKRFLLLFKKNLLWKIRNWKSTLFEVSFPVILCIILFLLSLVLPPESHATTQTAAKALPSAGLIPFLQTMYCDLTDTWTNGLDGLPNFKHSEVYTLYELIQKTSLSDDLRDSKFQSSLSSLASLTTANITDELTHTDNTLLLQRIAMLCKYNKQLIVQLGLNPAICTDPIHHKDIDVSTLDRNQILILYMLATITNSNNSITSLLSIQQDFLTYLQLSQELYKLSENPDKYLCGSNLTRSQNEYIYRFLGLILGPAFQNNSDNNTTQGLLENGVRILFSPDTPLTRSIAHEMNHTFELIDRARDSLNKIRDENYQLRSLLYNFSIADPKQLLVNDLRYLAKLQNVNPIPNLPSSSQLNQASSLLDINSPDSLWSYTQAVELYTRYTLSNAVFRVNWDFFRGYPTEQSILDVVTSSQRKRELNITYVLAGIIFQNITNATTLPPQSSYKIRMNFTTSMGSYLLRDISWKPGPENSDYDLNDLKYGYVFIQDLVERALINTYTNSTAHIPAGYLQPFPYPCFLFNSNLLIGQITIPLILTAGSVLTISLLARAIVQEREKRLRDVMSVLGVGVLEHWASWLAVYYILLAIPSLLSIAILKLVLTYSSFLILLLAQLSYNLALLPLGILLSLPFRRATVAASTVGLVYFLLYFLVILVQILEFRVPPITIVLSQLLAPTALGLFVYHTVQFELRGVGLHWNNLATSPLDKGFSTPGISWSCMCIDAILYTVLALYIQAILPGSYGRRHPWYFLITPSFWLGEDRWARIVQNLRRNKEYEEISGDSDELLMEEVTFDRASVPRVWEPLARERDPTHLTKGVSINQLGKVYSWGALGLKKKVALHSISLNLYEGHITVLLGHNGAGKTSLMMILSGINKQTSGSIRITHGRDSIGLCPQHNILFPHLTVKQHMNFYGALRGLTSSQIASDSNRLLECMALLPHMNKCVVNLSGGMARKLSVSLAFLGSPKLVILDEPTAGVDPASRRHIWDFLLSERQNRCILLSTHQMEEAEVLGDRIAMIDHGHILCIGAVPFLKANFGLNYLLTVEKKHTFDDVTHRQELYKILGDINGVKETVEELRFPLSNACVTSSRYNLPDILHKLESNRDRLHILSYGLSAPSLEQLFLMLTELRYTVDHDDDVIIDNTYKPVTRIKPNSFINKLKLLLLHSYALFLKRIHHTRRDVRGLLLQYIPFLCAILLAMILTVVYTVSGVPDVIRYHPGMYLSLSSPQYFFLSSPAVQSSADSYLSTITCPGGLGVVSDQPCVRNNKSIIHNSIQCSYCPTVWSIPKQNQTTPYNTSCNCNTGWLSCPPHASGPDPLEMVSQGDGSTLQDLRGRNVTDYLIRSFDRFILNRYQGVSFGDVRKDIPVFNTTDYNDMFGVRNYSKAWFTFKGFRAITSSLNVMNNAILRRELRDNLGYSRNFTSYGIIGNSEIWPLTPFQRVYAEITSGKPMLVSFMMFFGFSFLVAFSVVFVLEEKVSGTRYLQELSGLSQVVYWIVSFIYDVITYCVAVLLSMVIMGAFQYYPFVSKTHITTFLLAALGFGLTSISSLQLLSRPFKSPSLAYVVMACCTFVFGLMTLVIIFSLDITNNSSSKNFSIALKNTFVFIPQFSFPYILYHLITTYYYELEQAEVGFSIGLQKSDPFQWDPIGKCLLIIYVEFILVFVLTISVTFFSNFRSKYTHNCNENYPRDIVCDSDVEEERERVLANSNTSENTISLHNITKNYVTIKKLRKFTAVDNVTFAVKNECFGLLGLNGAGKTTIFDSITGIRALSSGKIYVKGVDVTKCRQEANRNMSYCPQFDSLFDRLTGREHLYLFGRLRGIHGNALKNAVDSTIRRLQLKEYANTPSAKYSGGNRRKLQTGIALISEPNLLLLDEPTSGVDPYAKQFLWELLRDVTNTGVSSLLTTHSMTECEALCTRIAIIHKGRVQCIGSPQHLKAKFGEGYILKVYLSLSHDNVAVIEEISNKLSRAVKPLESHLTLLTFHLENVCLPSLLRVLIEMKRGDLIADFSLGQTTLEDVFLSITDPLKSV
ncbi:hypothetical protein LOD99_6045 [Oopsacas minuta]|uniref:ABC transporter domain-containing protein n=1 Tax=Oopsacas minuta TaxID=111878 RepID=A0AAV7JNK0_9METZ|nr:hypothetical protein LOD99_6045 [Oopsacas minuta]